jgi:hypothetical protein
MTGACVRVFRNGNWIEDEIENLSQKELIGFLTHWQRNVNYTAKDAAEAGAKWILFLGNKLREAKAGQQEAEAVPTPSLFDWFEKVLRSGDFLPEKDVVRIMDTFKVELFKDV